MIVRSMKWIMLVSGLLTFSMVYAAFLPSAALVATFGETLEGPLAGIIVRNWGALIALVGGMLIYGAFKPEVRPLVLVVAGVSKVVFIGLVLSEGERYLRTTAINISVDVVMIVLFGWYLVAARSIPRPRPESVGV